MWVVYCLHIFQLLSLLLHVRDKKCGEGIKELYLGPKKQRGMTWFPELVDKHMFYSS